MQAGRRCPYPRIAPGRSGGQQSGQTNQLNALGNIGRASGTRPWTRRVANGSGGVSSAFQNAAKQSPVRRRQADASILHNNPYNYAVRLLRRPTRSRVDSHPVRRSRVSDQPGIAAAAILSRCRPRTLGGTSGAKHWWTGRGLRPLSVGAYRRASPTTCSRTTEHDAEPGQQCAARPRQWRHVQPTDPATIEHADPAPLMPLSITLPARPWSANVPTAKITISWGTSLGRKMYRTGMEEPDSRSPGRGGTPTANPGTSALTAYLQQLQQENPNVQLNQSSQSFPIPIPILNNIRTGGNGWLPQLGWGL